MDTEARASRRPMPRQMDVTDWNIDADVRSGVSSALPTYQRDRSAFDARADPSSRLSTGEELRSMATSMLRPVNRYDSSTSPPRALAAVPPYRSVEISSTRAYIRREERTSESHRPQPRAIPDIRNVEEVQARWNSYLGTTGRMPTQESWPNSTAANDSTPPRASGGHGRSHPCEGRPDSRGLSSTPSFLSPEREQLRRASTPGTVHSDATTAATSSPFTSSTTDSPATASSSVRTPPFTPLSDYTSSRRPASVSSTPQSTTTTGSSLDSYPESEPSSSARIEHDRGPLRPSQVPADSSPSFPPESQPPAATRSKTTAELSPQQQREQLYDFRREMRQVFSRVDEMVDLHRDMFKSDALSGIPEFNESTAHETASFANDTFSQLTALRQRFETMTKAWTQGESHAHHAPRQTARVQDDTSESSESLQAPSTLGHRDYARNQHRSSVPTSGDSSSPSSVSTRSSPDHSVSDHEDRRPRWEPTLSNLSDDSSSASSASEQSTSLASDTPTLSRPSTASSVGVAPKENVFEDFDKRMEEIRASLNAIAREKPRAAPPSAASSSSASPLAPWISASTKARSPPSSDDDDDDEPRENDARVGNCPPYHRAETQSHRRDREARLRQLLRELQTSGDDASTSSSCT